MSTELDGHPPIQFVVACRALRSAGLSLAVMASALLCGCDQTLQKTTTIEPRDVMAEDLARENAQPTASADTLVDRAQQDVDYFLKRRAAGAGATSNDASAGGSPILSAVPQTQANPAGRTSANIEQAKIIWNEPARVENSTDVAPSATTPAENDPEFQKLLEEVSSNYILSRKPDEANHASDDAVETQDAPLETSDRLIAELSRALYRDAAQSDVPVRELMLIAATSLIDKELAPSPTQLATLSERDRDLLLQMQNFFAQLGDQLTAAEDKQQAVLTAVSQLAQALDQRPPLAISTASLCTRVRGFGDYDQFSKYSFLAQQQQRLIVYVALENFTSAVSDDQQWVTELSQELIIYSDRDGIPVWSEQWQSVRDVTRNKRSDFFTVQLITLPPALTLGKYYLKVRMRDENTGGIAEKSIPFEMVADPRMAAK